jgi:hypothetical protein
MKSLVMKLKWLAVVPVLLFIAACSDNSGSASNTNTPGNTNTTSKSTDVAIMDVYKSETCGCCEDWISHIKTAGFHSVIHHPDDMGVLKSANGIEPQYRSCHTGISKDGFVFEGHIPAHLIKKFLAEPPKNAIGLAVPGMPLGSPGMEVEDRFSPYQVLVLNSDGTSRVFAEVKTAREQYE